MTTKPRQPPRDAFTVEKPTLEAALTRARNAVLLYNQSLFRGQPVITQSTINEQLRQILTDVLQREETLSEEIRFDDTFVELGVNSVDLVEFVLQVENCFDVSLLDEMPPDDVPETIAEWGFYLGSIASPKIAASAEPAN